MFVGWVYRTKDCVCSVCLVELCPALRRSVRACLISLLQCATESLSRRHTQWLHGISRYIDSSYVYSEGRIIPKDNE